VDYGLHTGRGYTVRYLTELTTSRLLNTCVYTNALIAVLICLYAFLIPAGLLAYDLNDPGHSS